MSFFLVSWGNLMLVWIWITFLFLLYWTTIVCVQFINTQKMKNHRNASLLIKQSRSDAALQIRDLIFRFFGCFLFNIDNQITNILASTQNLPIYIDWRQWRVDTLWIDEKKKNKFQLFSNFHQKMTFITPGMLWWIFKIRWVPSPPYGKSMAGKLTAPRVDPRLTSLMILPASSLPIANWASSVLPPICGVIMTLGQRLNSWSQF